jgi:hypothetical protein
LKETTAVWVSDASTIHGLSRTDKSLPDSGSTDFPTSNSSIPSPSSFEQLLSPSSEFQPERSQLATQRLDLVTAKTTPQSQPGTSAFSTDKHCLCRRQRIDLAPEQATLSKEGIDLQRENDMLRKRIKKLEERQETLLDIIQDRRGGDDPWRRKSSGIELRR